ICFSPNSIHALRNTSDFMEGVSHDGRSSTHFLMDEDGGRGWMEGPKGRLLFWVPPAFRKPFYTLGTVFMIPRGAPELDLSRMAHGQHWQKC
ncbi:uncharacterized protein EDB93DRAFT_1055980, partial [Suillus bovinus]|uniref:uncharacterized protein n=1 Tax=Suillus bovinus TaxID=48563 RepID=UPI001B85F210